MIKFPNPTKVKTLFITLRLVSGQFGNWASWSMEKSMLGTIAEATSASSRRPWHWLAGLLWCFWWVWLWMGNFVLAWMEDTSFLKSSMSRPCMAGLAMASPPPLMRNSRAASENQREVPSPLSLTHIGVALTCPQMLQRRRYSRDLVSLAWRTPTGAAEAGVWFDLSLDHTICHLCVHPLKTESVDTASGSPR